MCTCALVTARAGGVGLWARVGGGGLCVNQ